MDQNTQPEPWQVPVAQAFQAIKRLPGLEPGRVGFDPVQLAGQPWGPMSSAMLHAYAPVNRVPFTVRFAIQGASYVVRDHHGRSLTTRGLSAVLDLPSATGHRAFYLLKAALTETLALYNQAHRPARPSTAQPTSARGNRAPAGREPWPFAARPRTDESSGLAL